MSAEQRRSAVQSVLFQESDPTTAQTAYYDQIAGAYVAHFRERLNSDDFTPPIEEMVLGTLVRVMAPSRWESSPLASLIYEREWFRRSHEAGRQPEQFTHLDTLDPNTYDQPCGASVF